MKIYGFLNELIELMKKYNIKSIYSTGYRDICCIEVGSIPSITGFTFEGNMDRLEDNVSNEWTAKSSTEKIVERLKESSFDMSLENPDCKAVWTDKAIKIIREELQ